MAQKDTFANKLAGMLGRATGPLLGKAFNALNKISTSDITPLIAELTRLDEGKKLYAEMRGWGVTVRYATVSEIMVMSLIGTNVGGCYMQKKKEVVVNPKKDLMAQIEILAHELWHAQQDKNTGLIANEDKSNPYDRLIAGRVLEADALSYGYCFMFLYASALDDKRMKAYMSESLKVNDIPKEFNFAKARKDVFLGMINSEVMTGYNKFGNLSSLKRTLEEIEKGNISAQEANKILKRQYQTCNKYILRSITRVSIDPQKGTFLNENEIDQLSASLKAYNNFEAQAKEAAEEMLSRAGNITAIKKLAIQKAVLK